MMVRLLKVIFSVLDRFKTTNLSQEVSAKSVNNRQKRDARFFSKKVLIK